MKYFSFLNLSSMTSTLLFLILCSCIKSPSTKIDYGPEVSENFVKKTLITSLGPTDSPGLILKEETVRILETQFIRGRPVLDVLSHTKLTAVKRVETNNQWQVNITKEYQKLDPFQKGESFPVIISEDPQCWNKTTKNLEKCETLEAQVFPTTISKLSTEINNAHESDSLLNRFLDFNFSQRMNLFKEYEVKPSSKAKTYHKLTVNRGKIEPPEAVKNSTNCRNIPQCLINASIVDYDIVDWSRSPEGTKIHIHFIISPDVPQLARILESCQQGSIPVPQPGDDSLNPPRLLVTLCDTVSDFIPGQL